jgi:hypothetical protein
MENEMKCLRLMLIVLFAASGLAFAQSEMQHETDAKKSDAPKPEAQKSFDAMKTFAGEWEGRVTLVPAMPQWSDAQKPLHISMRVTSRGNAVVHEMQTAGTPLDAANYDHPVTTLYLDGGQLTLVHYCDAGNRPRMIGKISPDGKAIEFTLVDVSGGTEKGHMHHAVFTKLDPNHHNEDWIFMLPGDKPMHAHLELHRVAEPSNASAKVW